MKSSTRKIESSFDITGMLRQGLEGCSFKATLRLYLYGLCTLASVAALVVLLFSTEELFLITPLLAAALVGSQYFVCYATKGRLIKRIKNHRAFNFSLGLAGILIVVGVDIGLIKGYGETIFKIIAISLGTIAAIWLFWDVRRVRSAINRPMLGSVLATLTGAVVIFAIFQLITTSIQFTNDSNRLASAPDQPHSPGYHDDRQLSKKSRPNTNTTWIEAHKYELRITNLTTPTADETLLVKGSGATPTADVWVVVHPLWTNDYWVQSPASVTSSGEWSVTVYLGDPNNRGREFAIMAVNNPWDPLEPGMRLTDWPNAEQWSEVSLVTIP